MRTSIQIDKKNIEDIIALTPMQEGMLFHYLKEPGSLHYCEQLCLDISGDIDHRRFERAWHVVINTNEMLRTVFRWKNIEKPMQVILKDHPLKLKYYDCSNWDTSEKRKYIRGLIIKDRQKKFNLSHMPFRVILCKIEKFKYKVIISNHHILYDGWSNGIILKEFFDAYHYLAKGDRGTAPPVKTKFKEYVRCLQTGQIQDAQKQEKFWKNYLMGFDTQTRLTLGRKRMKYGAGTAVPGNECLVLEKGITDKLEIFIKENQLTLAIYFYCAWGILLQRYCNTDDVVFGATVSGRSAPIKGIENMVGLFINTLPIRIKTEPREKVMDLLDKLKVILPTWEAYDSTPLVNIKRYCGMEGEVDQEFFNFLVVIENYPLESSLKRQDSKLVISSYSMWESTHYDIALRISTTDHIALEVIYDNETGDVKIIKRLLEHFKNILVSIAENPGKALHDIEMLSEAEKEQLVWDFNNIGPRFPGDKTLHELFEKQVEQTPDNIALVGGKDEGLRGRRVEGKKKGISFTYNELNRLSDQLAHLLKEKGIQPDTIVGILVEPSVEMIVSLLGILKAGGAYLPINPQSPAARVQYMLEDSSANVLVTTRSLLEKVEKLRRWEGETILLGPATAVSSSLTLTCQVSPANLAYIIYTSGSTGKSKGVPITHANLSPLLHWGYRHLNVNSTDRVVQNLSYYFDWSVWEIFMALTSGASLYIVHRDIVLDASRYVDFINKNKITVLHITPTHFQSLAHREQKLSALKHLCIGAEKLSVDLVIRSYDLVDETCRVYNMYGPTEATIMAAVLEIDQANLPPYKDLTSVPIGKTLGNNTLLILDRDLNLCPILVTGELFIVGDGVAAGYLNRPELTAEKFDHDLWDYHDEKINQKFLRGGPGGAVFSKSAPPGRRRPKIYKTGDLVRWLPEGDIEFLGRIDHQVKIRGFRIELGEIETQLLSHKDIKEAVVIARQDESGDNYLCAYIIPNRVPGKIPDSKKLKEHLSNQLPEHMIPSAFVQIEFVPLTPNGKVHQKALPVPEIAVQKDYTPPRNKIEEKLAAVWSRVLGINRESIGIDDNFFQRGGNSLKATRLLARIHKEFDMELPLNELFKSPTVRGLSLYMEKSAKNLYSSLEPIEKKDYYPLSPAQKRLFVLQQKHPTNTAYHITGMVALEGKVQRDKLQKVFKALIDRHESLRTSFITVNEIPYQKVYSPGEVEFELEWYDAGHTENFILPFDLSQAPLMRVGLIEPPHTSTALRGHPRWSTYTSQEGKKQPYILMIDMHHIISDGVSTGILMKELMAFYAGKEQQELKVQYKEFGQWQQEQNQPGQISPQESYWLEQFQTGDDIPVLQLPTDYTRPAEKTFEGSTVTFEIPKENTRALKDLALKTETTFFMILLAAFNVFISKLSQQEDIVIGIPVSGRRHSDLEGIVGMFVNTLAIRNYPRGRETFLEFLEEVGENFLKAMENQDYQFEDLVEKIGPPLDAGRNPLFDVMLVLQNMETAVLDIPGLKLTPLPYAGEFSKFDITFIAEDKSNSLHFLVSYSTALFRKETIEGFIRCFKKVISVIPDNPGKKLSQIEIISPEEKQQILYEFNDTATDYPQEKTLHQLFAEQSGQTPDRIAVVGRYQSVPPAGKASAVMHISYKELNQKSDQLAYILKEKGVQRDAIVGLMLERSLEMVIGMMGILKAGGAYMPIDTDYPPTRVNYMLADSGAKFLVSMESMVSELSEVIQLSSLPWNSPLERGAPKGWGVSKPAVGPLDLAYIIYTSGSTGQPKGVLVEHRSAVNVVSWFGRIHNLAPGTHVLQMSDYTFDPSVNQVFGTLHRGALLCLISREVLTDMELLRQHINKHQIHVLNFVPPVLNELLSSGPRLESVRLVLSGGEKLADPVKDAILTTGYRLYNQYGPTETTIDVLVEKCSTDKVTLGKPISNVKCYIVDKDNNLAPIGIPGELCVAGAGVARGYLNNPETTNSKFQVPKKHRSYMSHTSYIYKTGDQAKWLPGGNIQFLGRLDHQVKIRGFRIEVEEIENRLLRLDGITECVVTARETIETMEGSHPGNENQRYLCAYFVSHRDWDTQQLKEYLSREVPGYMVPQHFVPLALLPLTATGKIDRDALPEPETGKGRIAPTNQTEETLLKIWAKVLMVKEEDIGMDDNFFQLGGHSLKITVIASEIHKAFDIKVPIDELFKRLTIKELAQYLQLSLEEKDAAGEPGEETAVPEIKPGAGDIPDNRYLEAADEYAAPQDQEEGKSIQPLEKKEYHQVSPAQRRLYILQQLDLKNTNYNMVGLLIIQGKLHREKFVEAFHRLIHRHEILRTSFIQVRGEVFQKVHEHIEFKPGYCKISTEEDVNERIEDFVKPFDLSKAPLLKMELIELQKEKHFVLFDIHHIVFDGFSMDILITDFVRFYKGKDPTPLQIQYKDYAAWQNKRLNEETLQLQEEYWLKKLQGFVFTQLPPDRFDRIHRVQGKKLQLEIEPLLYDKIETFCQKHNITKFVFMLSVFKIVLAREIEQTDITVGIPVSIREHYDLNDIIGIFLNVLLIRTIIFDEDTFINQLVKNNESVIEALNNQHYPYEILNSRIKKDSHLETNELFTILFNYFPVKLNKEMSPSASDLKIRSLEVREVSPKYDITLYVYEFRKYMTLELVYKSNIYDEYTIESLLEDFLNVIHLVLENNDMTISELTSLSLEENDHGDFDVEFEEYYEDDSE
jgi:amino acid adenylation domain-containing protein